MIVRRCAAPLAALMFTSTLIAGAGPAFAARGEDPDAEEERAEEERAKAEAEPPVPCPEEFWTVPLQIEGLACVLLLPKDEADQKQAQGDEEREEREGE